MKKLLPSLALLVLALVGCDKELEVARRAPAEKGVVVMVTTLGSEPYAYRDEKGEIVGIDIDIAREAVKKLGFELELRPLPFSGLLPSVKTGSADLAGAAITITPGRAKDVDFSEAYAFDGASFLYRVGESRPTVSRGNFMRIGTQVASNNQFYLSEHGIDAVLYPDYGDALLDFESGNLDAVFYDAETIRRTVAQSNGKYAMTSLFTRENFGLAIRKDFPELKAAVNEVLKNREGTK